MRKGCRSASRRQPDSQPREEHVVNEALPKWTGCPGYDQAMECMIRSGDGWIFLALLALAGFTVWYARKLFITVMTLRAMALTPSLTRRLSKWVRSHDYVEEDFFRADGADAKWVARRQHALDRLATHFQT